MSKVWPPLCEVTWVISGEKRGGRGIGKAFWARWFWAYLALYTITASAFGNGIHDPKKGDIEEVGRPFYRRDSL